MTKATSNRFSPEVRQRAVRMVIEHASDHHASQWAAIGSITAKIGNIPPAEAEARYYAQLEEQAVAA